MEWNKILTYDDQKCTSAASKSLHYILTRPCIVSLAKHPVDNVNHVTAGVDRKNNAYNSHNFTAALQIIQNIGHFPLTFFVNVVLFFIFNALHF